MKRNTLNFAVDGLTLIGMLAMIATGVLLRYILPPGSRGGGGLSVWGWTRHDWGDLHFWAAVGLGVLLLVHVALHWKWVCITIQRWLQNRDERSRAPQFWRRSAFGLGFLAAMSLLTGGFLWSAAASLKSGGERDESGERGQERTSASNGARGTAGGEGVAVAPRGGAGGRHEGNADEPSRGRADSGGMIRGSMTLADVERETGVSVAALRSALNLPDDVSADETLGQLRQRYGFEMSAVRELMRRPSDSHGSSSE